MCVCVCALSSELPYSKYDKNSSCYDFLFPCANRMLLLYMIIACLLDDTGTLPKLTSGSSVVSYAVMYKI